MDAVVSGVVAARAPGRTAVAYLGSPATAHIISDAAWEQSSILYSERPWHHMPFRFEPNARPKVDGVDSNGKPVSWAVTDGLSGECICWRPVFAATCY